MKAQNLPTALGMVREEGNTIRRIEDGRQDNEEDGTTKKQQPENGNSKPAGSTSIQTAGDERHRVGKSLSRGAARKSKGERMMLLTCLKFRHVLGK